MGYMADQTRMVLLFFYTQYPLLKCQYLVTITTQSFQILMDPDFPPCYHTTLFSWCTMIHVHIHRDLIARKSVHGCCWDKETLPRCSIIKNVTHLCLVSCVCHMLLRGHNDVCTPDKMLPDGWYDASAWWLGPLAKCRQMQMCKKENRPHGNYCSNSKPCRKALRHSSRPLWALRKK